MNTRVTSHIWTNKIYPHIYLCQKSAPYHGELRMQMHTWGSWVSFSSYFGTNFPNPDYYFGPVAYCPTTHLPVSQLLDILSSALSKAFLNMAPSLSQPIVLAQQPLVLSVVSIDSSKRRSQASKVGGLPLQPSLATNNSCVSTRRDTIWYLLSRGPGQRIFSIVWGSFFSTMGRGRW